MRRYSFCVCHVICAILIPTPAAVNTSSTGCYAQASRRLAMPRQLQGILPPVRVSSYMYPWGRRQGLLVARADDRCAERVCDASLTAQRRGPLRMDDASYSGAKARAGPRGERVRAKVHLESPPVHQSRPCRRAFKMQSLPPYSPRVLVRL